MALSMFANEGDLLCGIVEAFRGRERLGIPGNHDDMKEEYVIHLIRAEDIGGDIDDDGPLEISGTQEVKREPIVEKDGIDVTGSCEAQSPENPRRARDRQRVLRTQLTSG